MRVAGWIGILLLAAAGALALALHMAWLRIPPNWAPWGEVTLDEPPSWFARLQINSLSRDAAACRATLDRSMLEYRPVPERPLRDGCGIEGGVRPVRSQVPYGGGFTATCPLMAALYWYEARLDALARRHLGSGLARIEHLGTYACRNVDSADTGRRSQHATANAIDLSGFRLADGRTVSVLRHWGGDDPRGRFLAAARDEACRFFNTVLGPEYNAAHADHLHLDLGPSRLCR
jgi:hypothetical protein